MSAAKETLRRVREGLDHLQDGLLPFIEAKMKARHGANWLHYASRAAGSAANAPLDVYGLLKTILDNWNETFQEGFSRNERHRIRSFVTVAFDARNSTSHLTLPLQDAEALRYLDAILELLRAVKAAENITAEVKQLYEAQRTSGVTATPAPVQEARPTLSLAQPEDAPATKLKPWIEVALPHADVMEARFRQAEFAADLFAVDSGNVDAASDYATANGFFGITFLTEGLQRVLNTVLERLGGKGGDPVIGLQTAFGGGKTHTMLAAYHLAKASELGPLKGVPELAAKAGVTAWRPAKVAAFVGTAAGVDTHLALKDGPKVQTLWGYIAWRLAGAEGLALVAEAEGAETNPGSARLVELFKRSGPALILLDELVAYARQLPDDRFEAFLSFIQSLTEAAKMVPGILIIGSLPESNLQAGGDKGVAALKRLESVFGRVHSPWLPASGNETYEIIRRRLFQPLDADGEKARDETVKAFYDLYRKNQAEFPPEAKEPRYQELLRLSYPIHPELFDRLSKDWASLDKFQRTRGVLQFMANVIGVLWQARVPDPLITPARIPVANERVRASVLNPLDTGFGAVIDREVDGVGSLPDRMEVNPARRISQQRAATRAARAVFLCTAPLAGQPNAGVTGPGLRLACAEPGDQLAIFGEALRELSERATYLYEESGRYWFSTQPTLNRLADDKAKALAEHEVDADIIELLKTDAKTKGGFAWVFAAPDDPAAMDDVSSLSLVILGPGTPHAGKAAAKSLATDAVVEGLTRCRSSQRNFRNALIFVAADEGQLAAARDAMRQALAWADIAGDQRMKDQLPPAQMRDAAEKAKSKREGATRAVRLAWSHILYPVKSETAGKPFDLDQVTLASKDRTAIPAAVYEKVKGDSIVKDKLGPESLWVALKPLWPEGASYLTIGEVAKWFASFAYLPKIRDRLVLEGAIRDGVANTDARFGYADRYDEATGNYIGLAFGRTTPEHFPESAVLVSAAAALAQKSQLSAPPEAKPEWVVTGGGPSESVVGPKPAAKPTRFYGAVEIDPSRPIKSFETILDSVVLELQRNGSAKVKLTLEIEVDAAEGFEEADIGVVRDNARQLKFKLDSTGFE